MASTMNSSRTASTRMDMPELDPQILASIAQAVGSEEGDPFMFAQQQALTMFKLKKTVRQQSPSPGRPRPSIVRQSGGPCIVQQHGSASPLRISQRVSQHQRAGGDSLDRSRRIISPLDGSSRRSSDRIGSLRERKRAIEASNSDVQSNMDSTFNTDHTDQSSVKPPGIPPEMVQDVLRFEAELQERHRRETPTRAERSPSRQETGSTGIRQLPRVAGAASVCTTGENTAERICGTPSKEAPPVRQMKKKSKSGKKKKKSKKRKKQEQRDMMDVENLPWGESSNFNHHAGDSSLEFNTSSADFNNTSWTSCDFQNNSLQSLDDIATPTPLSIRNALNQSNLNSLPDMAASVHIELDNHSRATDSMSRLTDLTHHTGSTTATSRATRGGDHSTINTRSSRSTIKSLSLHSVIAANRDLLQKQYHAGGENEDWAHFDDQKQIHPQHSSVSWTARNNVPPLKSRPVPMPSHSEILRRKIPPELQRYPPVPSRSTSMEIASMAIPNGDGSQVMRSPSPIRILSEAQKRLGGGDHDFARQQAPHHDAFARQVGAYDSYTERTRKSRVGAYPEDNHSRMKKDKSRSGRFSYFFRKKNSAQQVLDSDESSDGGAYWLTHGQEQEQEKPPYLRTARFILTCTFIVSLVALGAGLGAYFGTVATQPGGGTARPVTDEPNYCGMEPLLKECKEDGTIITTFPSCIQERYESLREHFVPRVLPFFNLSFGSCEPANLALISVAAYANANDAGGEELVNNYLLSILYYATDGERWTNSYNWNGAQPGCDWRGVTCNSGSVITDIVVEYDNVGGALPTELGLLTGLKRVELGSNRLGGKLPEELMSLRSLGVLNLSGNFLTGTIPDSISDSITTLKLSFNELTGPIPGSLGQLTNLVNLNLGSNEFTGGIPTELFQCSNLEVLHLGATSLTGTIPTEIGLLTKIDDVDLVQNFLSSSIPTEFGLLQNMTNFLLSSPNLSGAIPSEFGVLLQLTKLSIFSTLLSGTLPSEMGALTALTELTLAQNSMVGGLPTELGNMAALEKLDMSQNEFDGTLPTELGLLENLVSLLINLNTIVGDVPVQVCSLYESSLNVFIGDFCDDLTCPVSTPKCCGCS